MATYYYVKTPDSESIVVSGEVSRTLASSHPSFSRIRDYCFAQEKAGQPIDMNQVLRWADAEQFISDELLCITDRVSFKGGKLLWDGEPTEGALSEHIIRMIKNRDDNYLAFAKFLENLAQNPSEASRAALFEWIADRGFTVTEEGHFIGYKGVESNYLSQHAGYGIVNGVEVTGKLDNTPGNVVEVPRNKVDADRNSTCSYGLHVGTSSYANTYGQRRIIVAVNPRDVVMVPNDANGEKMRVCRYVVLEDNDDKPLTTTTYTGSHRVEEDNGSIDECEDCGCTVNGQGLCVCCNDVCGDCLAVVDSNFLCDCSEEEEERTECSECGDWDDTGTGTCSDCDEVEYAIDVNLCPDCGDEIDSDEVQCEECEEAEDKQRRAEAEADDLAVREQFAREDEQDTLAEQRPSPYGICQWDGAALDAEGCCTLRGLYRSS